MKKSQSDMNLDFDGGKAYPDSIYNYNSKFQNNKNDSIKNPDRMNVGRGPTRVGAGSTGVGPKTPPVGTGSKSYPMQYRGQGGTEVKCPTDYDKQNVGRGPTKGNQQ